MHTNKFEIKNILTRGMAVLAVLFLFTAQVNSQAVILTAPTNGATNVSTLPSFTWTWTPPAGFSGDVEYHVRIFNAGGINQLANGTTWNNTSFQWPANDPFQFLPGTEYRVVVEAHYGINPQNTVQTHADFTTAADGFAVLFINPTNNSNSVSTLPDFQWAPGGLTGPVTYTLNVKKQINGGAGLNFGPLVDFTNFPLPLADQLLFNTKYTVTLTYTDNVGHSGIATSTFTTQVQPAVTFTYPVNTLTGVSILPKFSWTGNNLTNPVYTLTVTKVGNVNPVATINNGFTTANGVTSYQWTEENGLLENGTAYNVTVSFTHDGDPVVNNSTSVTFTTYVVSNFFLQLPIDGGTDVARSSVAFYWYCSLKGSSIRYTLQYMPEPAGLIPPALPSAADWAAGTSKPGLSALSTTVAGLAQNKKYYWRVLAYNTSGVAPVLVGVSNVFTFTTAGAVTQPFLSYPVDQPVYEALPTFYWWSLNFDPANVYDLSIREQMGGVEVYKATNIIGTKHKLVLGNFVNGATRLVGGLNYIWTVTAKMNNTHLTIDGVASDPSTFMANGPGKVYKPILSYPTAGTEVYTLRPTLYWYLGGVTSGINYLVHVYTVDAQGNFAGTIELEDVTDKLQYTMTTDLPIGREFRWDVMATGPGGMELSDIESFTVAPALGPGDPVASWPVDNATVYTTKPSLSWWLNGSKTGITGYTVAWAPATAIPFDDNLWEAFIANAANTNSFNAAIPASASSFTVPNPLASGTEYQWAVKKNLSTTWSTGSFTTLAASVVANGTATASWPVGGVEVSTVTPKLWWWWNGSSATATDLTIKISRTEDFSAATDPNNNKPFTITKNGIAKSATSYQVLAADALIQGATYYYKIIANYPNNVKTESTPETFVVQSANGVVVPVAGNPANGVAIKNGNPVLSWVIPTQTTSAMTYEAQYSTKSDMSKAVTLTGLKSNKVPVSGLVNGIYYWRVRAVDSKGTYSSYSGKESFVITGATSVEQRPGVPADFTLEQNYPNPFNPSTLIRFSLPKESMVTLKIYDIMGQEVKTLVNEAMSAGNFDVQWNGDDNNGNKVQSGTYIYRITTENNSVARKMMLVK